MKSRYAKNVFIRERKNSFMFIIMCCAGLYFAARYIIDDSENAVFTEAVIKRGIEGMANYSVTGLFFSKLWFFILVIIFSIYCINSVHLKRIIILLPLITGIKAGLEMAYMFIYSPASKTFVFWVVEFLDVMVIMSYYNMMVKKESAAGNIFLKSLVIFSVTALLESIILFLFI